MACPIQTLCLTAGQIWDMPVTFTDDAGDALDLTGATVHLMAKSGLADEDGDAVLDISQASHTDAAGGATTLTIDLSALAETYWISGGKLSASLWLEDADDQRIPYGLLILEIQPSAKWKPAAV